MYLLRGLNCNKQRHGWNGMGKQQNKHTWAKVSEIEGSVLYEHSLTHHRSVQDSHELNEKTGSHWHSWPFPVLALVEKCPVNLLLNHDF